MASPVSIDNFITFGKLERIESMLERVQAILPPAFEVAIVPMGFGKKRKKLGE